MPDYSGAFRAGAEAFSSGFRTGMELGKLAEERAFRKDFERKQVEMKAAIQATRSEAAVEVARLEEYQRHAEAGTKLPDGQEVTPQMLEAQEERAFNKGLDAFQRRMDLTAEWSISPNPHVAEAGKTYAQQNFGEMQVFVQLAGRKAERQDRLAAEATRQRERKGDIERAGAERREDIEREDVREARVATVEQQRISLEARRVATEEKRTDAEVKRAEREDDPALKAAERLAAVREIAGAQPLDVSDETWAAQHGIPIEEFSNVKGQLTLDPDDQTRIGRLAAVAREARKNLTRLTGPERGRAQRMISEAERKIQEIRTKPQEQVAEELEWEAMTQGEKLAHYGSAISALLTPIMGSGTTPTPEP